MPESFACPYLAAADVELTDERRRHIVDEHPDFEPYLDRIGPTLLEPDLVRRSRHQSALPLV
jgi:hypothetical protein